MKKIMLYILFALVLVSAVFAANTITISPENPTENDDLTCLVNGNIDTDYAFIWYVNNNYISTSNPANQAATYVLSSTYLHINDIVKCEVYTPSPWGTFFEGSAQVTIQEGDYIDFPWPIPTICELQPWVCEPWSFTPNVTLINLAPILNLPDVTFYYGESETLQLDNYVADETPDNQLVWTHTGGVKTHVAIDASRNAVFTGDENFFGTEQMTFTVTDAQGLSTSQTIDVTVLSNIFWPIPTICDMYPVLCEPWSFTPNITPINFAPTVNIIEPADNAVFATNYGLIKFVAEYSDFNKDPVTLVWNFGDGTPNTDPVQTTYTASTGTIFHTFTTPGDYIIRVQASDGRGGTAQDSITIHVIAGNETNITIVDDDDSPKHPKGDGRCSDNIDVVSITPLNYQEIYKPGEVLSLLIKVKNNGCDKEKLMLRVYNLAGNEVYKLPDLRIESIESQTVQYDFYVPYVTGAQLLKVSITDQNSDYSLAKYFQYNVA